MFLLEVSAGGHSGNGSGLSLMRLLLSIQIWWVHAAVIVAIIVAAVACLFLTHSDIYVLSLDSARKSVSK